MGEQGNNGGMKAMSSKYEVGYKKPPKQSQFKKGQSGNPKGKPKAATHGLKQLEELIKDELSQTVEVVESGKKRKVTKQQYLIKQLVNQAAKGHFKALPYLLELMNKMKLTPDDDGVTFRITSETFKLIEQAVAEGEAYMSCGNLGLDDHLVEPT